MVGTDHDGIGTEQREYDGQIDSKCAHDSFSI